VDGLGFGQFIVEYAVEAPSPRIAVQIGARSIILSDVPAAQYHPSVDIPGLSGWYDKGQPPGGQDGPGSTLPAKPGIFII